MTTARRKKLLTQSLANVFRRVFCLGPRFLCDTCRYDYDTACRRPQRPNAVRCPDYARGGKG